MDVAEIKLNKNDYSKEDKKKRVQETMEKVGVQKLENHSDQAVERRAEEESIRCRSVDRIPESLYM